MAMIKCPECGREISDLAEKCPNCGFPIGFSSTTSSDSNTQVASANNPYQQQFNTPPVKPYGQKKKNSTLGVLALIFSILGCTFIVGIILAIIDLCKKDENKKTCSIIALCICGFWLIIGIAASSGEDSAKETAATAVTESNQKSDTMDQETNSKENDIEAKKPEEENAPEPIEEEKDAEEEQKDKYYIGDTWQNKYVLVSYDDCGEYESDNQFIQPKSGNKYVYATFTFENVGNSDTTVAYWDFDCYADGYACEGTYGADGAAFSQTLSSGRKITGTVYFEVPEEAVEIEFEYSPSFWTSEKIVFVYQ